MWAGVRILWKCSLLMHMASVSKQEPVVSPPRTQAHCGAYGWGWGACLGLCHAHSCSPVDQDPDPRGITAGRVSCDDAVENRPTVCLQVGSFFASLPGCSNMPDHPFAGEAEEVPPRSHSDAIFCLFYQLGLTPPPPAPRSSCVFF